MAVLLTCNSNVPGPEHPGTPALVFFDNGDWEIAFNGDVDYISDSPAYVGTDLVSKILSELSLEYDGDEMDEVDGETILFIDITIEETGPAIPVLALFDDGFSQIMAAGDAQMLIGSDGGVFNYVQLAEFMDDLRKFLSKNRTAMFGRDDEDERPPLDFEDEDRD